MMREPQEYELAVEIRIIVLQISGDTSLSGKHRTNHLFPVPPVRGKFGERMISLVEGDVSVILPSYRIRKERMEIQKRLGQ